MPQLMPAFALLCVRFLATIQPLYRYRREGLALLHSSKP